MIDMKELERMGLEAGFTHVALLKSSTLELMPEVREMCEKNTCHMYNKRWSCPPGWRRSGSLSEKDQPVRGRDYRSDGWPVGRSHGRRDHDGDRSHS